MTDVYSLLLDYRDGASVYLFEYTPTPERPYPDIKKVMTAAEIEFDPEDGDYITVNRLRREEKFTAAEVGSDSDIDPDGGVLSDD